MSPLTGLTTGVRCWPQWKHWGFCYQTGDLIDPHGQAYSPQKIQALAWALQLHELRDRIIYADSGPQRTAVALADFLQDDGTLRTLRERQHAAHAAARTLPP